MKIELESIGTIHTEFKDIEGMPIQPTGAKGVEGKIVLDEKYAAGLKDLEDFSHIHLLYLRIPVRSKTFYGQQHTRSFRNKISKKTKPHRFFCSKIR